MSTHTHNKVSQVCYVFLSNDFSFTFLSLKPLPCCLCRDLILFPYQLVARWSKENRFLLQKKRRKTEASLLPVYLTASCSPLLTDAGALINEKDWADKIELNFHSLYNNKVSQRSIFISCCKVVTFTLS